MVSGMLMAIGNRSAGNGIGARRERRRELSEKTQVTRLIGLDRSFVLCRIGHLYLPREILTTPGTLPSAPPYPRASAPAYAHHSPQPLPPRLSAPPPPVPSQPFG